MRFLFEIQGGLELCLKGGAGVRGGLHPNADPLTNHPPTKTTTPRPRHTPISSWDRGDADPVTGSVAEEHHVGAGGHRPAETRRL
ncbi:hypothetical protein VZT92_011534 [Zoarces viviparus]|uniref:Uncharacterized protein n=1 Tax=Zoarces viviparus TaxID=48416 RepID=A0AAW1F505_ZOAVI